MNVLIINIDRPQRGVYSGMIAACLLKKIPFLKITGFVATGNKILSTTGLFEQLHYFDTEAFFNRTKDYTSTDVEKEIRKALAPVCEIHWDVVINLSSNLIGPIFTNFLQSKDVKGSFLDLNLSGLKYSDQSSFFLSSESNDLFNYFHFAYLYRSILKRFEILSLTSVWDSEIQKEFRDHFEDLKAKHSRPRIVLIDCGIRKSKKTEEVEFLASTYLNFSAEADCLPILIGKSLDENDPLIKKLKSVVKGEVYALTCETEAQLSMLGVGTLLVTDDLYLKAIADLGLVPSILITKKINTSDYSVIDGSCQVVSEHFDEKLSEILPLVYRLAVEKECLHIDLLTGVEIYQTKLSEQLPILAPVNTEGSPEYASWWLGTRYIATILKVGTPKLKVSQKFYRNAILLEQQNVLKKGSEGIYPLALELSTAQIKNAPPIQEEKIIQNLTLFLKSEEAGL